MGQIKIVNVDTCPLANSKCEESGDKLTYAGLRAVIFIKFWTQLMDNL